MTTIFLSYAEIDVDFSYRLFSELVGNGYEVRSTSSNEFNAGENWRESLTAALSETDVFVALISDEALSSHSFMEEVGIARSYASSSGRVLIIPVVIDDIPVPPILSDIQALIVPTRDTKRIVAGIRRAIAAFAGRKAAQEERAVQVAQRIEKNAATFIDDAVQAQTVAEKRNRLWGSAWYVGGFTALIAGLIFAGESFVDLTTSGESTEAVSAVGTPNWPLLIETVFHGIIAIGFLAASARYAFALGKSYIGEALKCSDRIHAIAFGKFYLQAYGEKATWPELKEVFQHWNIDRASTFSSLNVSEIDPQILALLNALTKSAIGKIKGE